MKSSRYILSHIFRTYLSDKKWIIFMTLSFLANAFYTLDAYFVAKIIDGLKVFLTENGSPWLIYNPFILLILTGGATWVFNRLRELIEIRSIIDMSKNIYTKIFYHLHGHSMEYFANNFAGSLFKRISRYVRVFEDFSDLLCHQLMPIAVHLIITISIVFYFSWIAGVIVVVYALGYSLMAYWFERDRHTAIDDHDRSDSAFSGYVTDTISNHSTIKGFGKFGQENRAFQYKLSDTYGKLEKVWRKGFTMYATLGAIAFIVYWILTGFGLWLAMNGHIVFATFLIINTYNGVLTDRLWGINGIFKSWSKNIADAREGVEILDTPHTLKDGKDAPTLIANNGHIRFENAVFGYGNKEIFSNLSIDIPPGQKVGIVGVSGSGKSTLTKLLMRLYDINSGHITIDNFDIQKVTQVSLHKSIALVPQDPILFHRSLRENIIYANPDIGDKEFQRYCQIAHCEEFISRLPKSYETLVGERGIKLSGGERQRVAIARALVAETPIIIFDEATSALDSESEKFIQDAMFHAIEKKTALVIAHRLSTIVHMDRILVFHEGTIIEDGTHAELMKKNGTYARLWTIQSGEFRE